MATDSPEGLDPYTMDARWTRQMNATPPDVRPAFGSRLSGIRTGERNRRTRRPASGGARRQGSADRSRAGWGAGDSFPWSAARSLSGASGRLGGGLILGRFSCSLPGHVEPLFPCGQGGMRDARLVRWRDAMQPGGAVARKTRGRTRATANPVRSLRHSRSFLVSHATDDGWAPVLNPCPVGLTGPPWGEGPVRVASRCFGGQCLRLWWGGS